MIQRINESVHLFRVFFLRAAQKNRFGMNLAVEGTFTTDI